MVEASGTVTSQVGQWNLGDIRQCADCCLAPDEFGSNFLSTKNCSAGTCWPTRQALSKGGSAGHKDRAVT